MPKKEGVWGRRPLRCPLAHECKALTPPNGKELRPMTCLKSTACCPKEAATPSSSPVTKIFGSSAAIRLAFKRHEMNQHLVQAPIQGCKQTTSSAAGISCFARLGTVNIDLPRRDNGRIVPSQTFDIMFLISGYDSDNQTSRSSAVILQASSAPRNASKHTEILERRRLANCRCMSYSVLILPNLLSGRR